MTPSCTAVDTASGQALPQESVDGSYRREGGSAGDWVGVATIEPKAATLDVTCTLDDGSASPSRGSLDEGDGVLVAVDTAPVLPAPLATFGPWGVVPIAFALAGLLAVMASAVLAIRRRAGCLVGGRCA